MKWREGGVGVGGVAGGWVGGAGGIGVGNVQFWGRFWEQAGGVDAKKCRES